MIKKIEVIQEYATQNANLMLDPAERAYLQKITEYITQIEGNDTWKTMIIPLDQNPNYKKGVMDFGQMELEQTNPMFESPQMIIGKAFLQSAEFFKSYFQYCSNQPQQNKTISELNQNSQFEAFIKERTSLIEDCRSLDLADFLIKPVQRVCKYPLLIRVYFSCLPFLICLGAKY